MLAGPSRGMPRVEPAGQKVIDFGTQLMDLCFYDLFILALSGSLLLEAADGVVDACLSWFLARSTQFWSRTRDTEAVGL